MLLWVRVLYDGMWDGRVRFSGGFLWVGFAVRGRLGSVEFVVFDGSVVVCFGEVGDARDPVEVEVLRGELHVGCWDVHVSEELIVLDREETSCE